MCLHVFPSLATPESSPVSACVGVCLIADLLTFDAGTCPPLTAIVDGSTTYSSDVDENGFYLPGTVSSSACDSGSLSTGDEERVCQSDSTWTNTQLICTSECVDISPCFYSLWKTRPFVLFLLFS